VIVGERGGSERVLLGSEKRFNVERRRANDCKRELERERVVLEVVVEDELSVLDRVRIDCDVPDRSLGVLEDTL
jgi:hypothetical protein